jgi:SPASM domain peptide maturase of grasp-with-spasm system
MYYCSVSCLNREISIDADGNIKNCPSMKESFGNIRDTTLAEAIEKPGFKKYWDINKDQIAVCKDCEFRYICTDCRAYVEDPHDASGPDGTNLSKPLKCGYNPYTGEWAEWSTNPLKQKAIDFYGMREMVDVESSNSSNNLKEE